MVEIEVIFGSDRIKAEYHRVPGATSVVVHWASLIPRRDSFSEETERNDRFFRGLGMSAICVYPRYNDWYLNDSLPDLLYAIETLAKGYAEVISYGLSMGGYAAVLTASDLRVDKVIAISPQFSVDPRKVPFETRWQRLLEKMDFRHDRLRNDGQSSALGVVVVDPMHKLDALHCDQILRMFPSWKRLNLPMGGHSATACLRDAGKIGDFGRALLRDDYDPGVLLGMHKAARSRSFAYWMEFTRNAQKKHGLWARRAISRAMELETPAAESLFQLGKLAIHNDLRLGIRIMRRAVELHPPPPANWRRQIRALRVTGKPSG